MPGVSTKTSCVFGSVKTPLIWCRVVWGLLDVIATFSPQIALTSEDFPTFGLPTTVTNPDRWVDG